jgi:hypothetical protein
MPQPLTAIHEHLAVMRIRVQAAGKGRVPREPNLALRISDRHRLPGMANRSPSLDVAADTTASIERFRARFLREVADGSNLPYRIPTSPDYQGEPVPSMTRPWMITRSNCACVS